MSTQAERVRSLDIRWLAVAALGIAVGAAALTGIILFVSLPGVRKDVQRDHVIVERISKSPCANLTIHTCIDRLDHYRTPAQRERIRGPKGERGARGPRGLRGSRGPAGPPGRTITGSRGPTGASGAPGRDGSNGTAGRDGQPDVTVTVPVPALPPIAVPPLPALP